MEPIKHLNMRQVRQLRAMADDDADVFAIAWSCEKPESEVRAWFEAVPAGEVAKAIAKVFAKSGLTDDARFQG